MKNYLSALLAPILVWASWPTPACASYRAASAGSAAAARVGAPTSPLVPVSPGPCFATPLGNLPDIADAGSLVKAGPSPTAADPGLAFFESSIALPHAFGLSALLALPGSEGFAETTSGAAVRPFPAARARRPMAGLMRLEQELSRKSSAAGREGRDGAGALLDRFFSGGSARDRAASSSTAGLWGDASAAGSRGLRRAATPLRVGLRKSSGKPALARQEDAASSAGQDAQYRVRKTHVPDWERGFRWISLELRKRLFGPIPWGGVVIRTYNQEQYATGEASEQDKMGGVFLVVEEYSYGEWNGKILIIDQTPFSFTGYKYDLFTGRFQYSSSSLFSSLRDWLNRYIPAFKRGPAAMIPYLRRARRSIRDKETRVTLEHAIDIIQEYR